MCPCVCLSVHNGLVGHGPSQSCTGGNFPSRMTVGTENCHDGMAGGGEGMAWYRTWSGGENDGGDRVPP